MKPAYIIAMAIALLLAPPCSYGEANDGKDNQVAAPCPCAEANDGMDNRVVNLTLLPIDDDKLRTQLWNELERIAQPFPLVVATNQSPKDALRACCGSAPIDLQKILAKLNPGLSFDIPGEARELKFIPCPFWAFYNDKYKHPAAKIPIRKGQLLSDVVSLYGGIAGPITIDKIMAANSTLLLDDQGRAKADGVIRMPYVTNSVTFRLRDEIKENKDEIVLQLKGQFPLQMPGAIYSGNVSDAGQTYRLIIAQGQVGATECKGPIGDGQWPFDMTRIADRYEETRQELEKMREKIVGKNPRIPPPPPSKVVVADTGIDLSDPMSNRNLWMNPAVIYPTLGSPFGNNRNGANLIVSSGGIGVSPDYDFPFHGTQVVSIMSGSLFARENLLGAFQIAVAKIVPDRKPYDIPVNAVSNAFIFASAIQASVLNLSVVIGSPEAGLVKGLNSADFLVVSAAGNNKKLVQGACVYPPGLSQSRDNLIVVGAHDWEYQRADFSNYGEQMVDLLAPGCKIPVRGTDGKIQPQSGTSFAAPFVSFTAALLNSLQGMSAKEIKSRILATVDFDESLAHIVSSAGRLNIENALSINDDILVIKEDGKVVPPLHGELEKYQRWTCIMSSGERREYFPNQVGRVVPNFPDHGSKVFMVWERPNDAGKLIETQCDVIEGVVAFRKKGANPGLDYVAYDWDEVVSVSPKLPRLR